MLGYAPAPWADPPPWVDPPRADTPPARHPPPSQTPPWADTLPGQNPPPSRRLRQRTVRILLECILVLCMHLEKYPMLQLMFLL